MPKPTPKIKQLTERIAELENILKTIRFMASEQIDIRQVADQGIPPLYSVEHTGNGYVVKKVNKKPRRPVRLNSKP
jgi:hypothetical protein